MDKAGLNSACAVAVNLESIEDQDIGEESKPQDNLRLVREQDADDFRIYADQLPLNLNSDGQRLPQVVDQRLLW